MHRYKSIVLFLVLLILPACATPIPTAISQPTQVSPKRGGSVTIAVWQSPTTLNNFLGAQNVMNDIITLVIEGMTRIQPDGTRVANLVKQVPALDNGGVSADGKTITYHLKEGVRWSDGTPFTCDDAKFTWQAVMTPNVGVTSTTGYSDIATVECPDPLTVVVKYKNFYAPYIGVFDRILPKSVGDPKNMKNWEYNRKPLGTGPFKIQEWVTDDHLTLVRNENYREADKPYLEQIIVRIVPSVDAGLKLLSTGEVDIVWSIPIDNVPQLEKMSGVKYSAPPRLGGERIFLNLAESKDASDPTKPHQILGDVQVRKALALAINKQRIVDNLLFGKVALLPSELNIGPFACDNIKQYPYDPTQSKKILDAAGWVVGSDGIRVAKGSKFTPDGTRLRLKYSTTSGDKLREDTQALVIEDLKAVGIDAYVENAPSSVVIGTWDAASPRRRGNFDLIEYSTTGGIDPHSQIVDLFASWQIPSEKNKGGPNLTRFSNSQVDQLLTQASKEPDANKRKPMYCQVLQIGYESYNMVYLYQAGRAYAYRDRLQGWIANGWNSIGWNAQDWWVK